MAPLTRDRKTTFQEGERLAHYVKGGVRIFLGSLVNIDANGYAVPAVDNPSHKFAGVAVCAVDNRDGVDGAKQVVVYRDGVHQFDIDSPLTNTDYNEPCYIVDDNTVTLTPGDVRCGVIGKFRSATIAHVDIEGAFGSSVAGPAGPPGPTGATGPAGPQGDPGPAILTFGSSAVGRSITTRYLAPQADGLIAAVTEMPIDAPIGGTARNLYVRHTIVGVGGTIRYELIRNGLATGLFLDLASSSTSGSELIKTAAITAGDRLALRVTKAISVVKSPRNVVATLELA